MGSAILQIFELLDGKESAFFESLLTNGYGTDSSGFEYTLELQAIVTNGDGEDSCWVQFVDLKGVKYSALFDHKKREPYHADISRIQQNCDLKKMSGSEFNFSRLSR